LLQALKTERLGGKRISTTARMYEKSTMGYTTTCKTQTRAAAGTQENSTCRKHINQSELQPIPFLLTYWKNTKVLLLL
jgi:hypothetical protein